MVLVSAYEFLDEIWSKGGVLLRWKSSSGKAAEAPVFSIEEKTVTPYWFIPSILVGLKESV